MTVPCSMWDVSSPGIEPTPPVLETWSLTTLDHRSPPDFNLFFLIYFLFLNIEV